MRLYLPRRVTAPLALVLALGGAACDSDSDERPDASAAPDAPSDAAGCDPATALPSNFRPIPMVSAGEVQSAATGGVITASIDATAGGTTSAPDNPYIYVDLAGAAKVALTDLEARTSPAWDIALKRASLRVNGGDSGPGGRELATVAAATLAEVTAAPATGYVTDDFADADCLPVTLPGGEPRSAFGEWYAYDVATHAVSPKPEVYVLTRPDGSRAALRVITYYGDPASPMRGAYYQVEWKAL